MGSGPDKDRHGGIDDRGSYALALAKREGCSLLIGDRRLRAAAEREGVPVRGTLWVAARLLEAGLLLPERAWAAFERDESERPPPAVGPRPRVVPATAARACRNVPGAV